MISGSSDLIIRYRRVGNLHNASYQIVLINKNKRSRGPLIEKLGFFNPSETQHMFYINVARVGFWLNKGARLHPTVKKRLSILIY